MRFLISEVPLYCKLAGLEVQALAEHERLGRIFRSHSGDRDHDLGVKKGMFCDRDREPVSCFVNMDPESGVAGTGRA